MHAPVGRGSGRTAFARACASLGILAGALGAAVSARAQEAAAPDTVAVIPARGAATSRPADPSALESLDGRPIRSVEARVHNVFDPLPTGPMRSVGRLANRVHMRTRAGVVRDQFLLHPGDTWTRARGEEAARQLRTLDFLEPMRLEAVPAGDSVDVRVETRDVWTTQPEFDVERGGGQVFGMFGFTEHNLFGFGKTVTLAYRQDPVGITRSAGLEDPGVAGSRLQLRVSGARGTSGASDAIEAAVPFYALDTRWSFGVTGLRRSGTAHLFQNNAEVATLGEHLEESRAFIGRGWRSGGIVRRVTVSAGSIDRRLDPTSTTPDADVPESFVGPQEFLRLRDVMAEVRLWEPRFIERTGVARVDQVEDFDLGPSLSVGLGIAPRAFGSDSDYGLFRSRLDVGTSTPFGFGQLSTQFTGRWRSSAEEVQQTSRARWIWQRRPEHTIEASLLGSSGFRMPRNYQVVIGGLNGLRAYPVHAVAGARVLRWNVEDRHMLVRDVLQFVSIGSALFWDGARGWGPGAEGTGPFNCAGVGLRLAPPRTAIGPILRADVAWPITPTRDGRREAVLSIGSSRAF